MAVLIHKHQLFIWQNFSQQAFILLAISLTTTARADRLLTSLCQKPLLSDLIFPENDQCFPDSLPAEYIKPFPFSSRVIEGKGTIAEFVLEVLQKNHDTYLAVLFYAQWCPFSKSLRRTFDLISVHFPGIHHVAVEGSALRASKLLYYGVRNFPSMFLQNKTTRVRYSGPRTIEALSRFYNDVTGLHPSSSDILQQGIAFKKDVTEELVKYRSYTGISSLKKLFLHDDMYLTFATLFLLLRILHYAIPKVVFWVKQYFIQRVYILHAAKAARRRETHLLAEGEQCIKKSKVDKGKGERAEIVQGGAKVVGGTFVQCWSSSPLAPVTLAGGSSSKGWENNKNCQGP